MSEAELARDLGEAPAAADRFTLEEQLGSGGMGVVYRAHDRDYGTHVALKLLHYLEPVAIYRFKREFRALADVVHPNLVALHELFSTGEEWFFTMELVAGQDFVTYVRDGIERRSRLPAEAPTIQELTAAAAPGFGARLDGPAVPLRSPFHVVRLRNALRQLADGVETLHQAGKLHCDLKPSNVLVTGTNRVVILDFGLVAEFGLGHGMTTKNVAAGTPDYMAPEQAAQQKLGPASDWYGVGAILYQALTGRLPFSGTAVEVIAAKASVDPPRPGEIAPGVPEDLDRLCMELLQRDPASRPDGREVLDRLGSVRPTSVRVRPPVRSRSPFVGRARELGQLRAALERVERGEPAALLIEGSSGMGKSALLGHFIDELRGARRAVVLAGRCYERESVPFKALDSLMDDLMRHLMRLPRDEVEEILPREIGALARLFPVLSRVDAVAAPRLRTFEVPDPLELRQRASEALRELLGVLARRGPLVLSIDDLQWSDSDSISLLVEATRAPAAPPLLLVASYRSEEAHGRPPLRAFLDAIAPAADRMVVDALEPDEAHALARAFLGPGPEVQAFVARIAVEGQGNPYFVSELVRFLPDGESLEATSITLDDVLRLRIERLPETVRRLLEVIAVANRPLEVSVATRAAEVGADTFAAVTRLRQEHLVQSRRVRDREALECLHARIREIVIAHLDERTQRGHHERLARELEAAPTPDAEALALHLRGAGEAIRAARYAAAAAEQSVATLAFDHAVSLYRLALEWIGDSGEVADLRVRLGDALASSGRSAEAAQQYVLAADVAAPGAVLHLKTRAAEHFLISGHLERGLELLRDVLGSAGLAMPGSPRAALLRLLGGRAQIALRGLGFELRDEAAIPREALLRTDVAWAATTGFAMTDSIRSKYFADRALVFALRAGEARRIVRTLACEACFVAAEGGVERAQRRTRAIRGRIEELATRIAQPWLPASVSTVGSFSAYQFGRFSEAITEADRALALFRDQCSGFQWEIDSLEAWALWALSYRGDTAEMARRITRLSREAQSRGNLYAYTNLHLGLPNVVRLASDDTRGARAVASEAIQRWSQREQYHLQHYWELYAQVQIDLYEGEGARARGRVLAGWDALEASLLLRVRMLRVEAAFLRGRTAVAVASLARADAEGAWREAERAARGLRRERFPVADGLAALLGALVALGRRDERAPDELRTAASALDASELHLHAAAARRRLGQLVGASEGGALISDADERMRSLGVTRPERMTDLLAPARP